MSSSKLLLRNGFLVLALATAPLISACTFSPVYSGAGAESAQFDIAYAEPNSRLEQIIYQELRLRLGASTAPSASLVSVAVSRSSGSEALSDTPNPNTLGQLTLTARLTVAPRDGSGEPPLTITRRATANYNTTSQALSNQEALIDAEERAARSVAESLRLALLAALPR